MAERVAPALSRFGLQGRIFDLGQPLRSDMPQMPGPGQFSLSLYRRHGDDVHPNGLSMASEVLILRGHHGTHVDALGHISQDGKLHGGIPAAEAQSHSGLTALGIETIAPIVSRFVLFDLPAEAGDEPLAPGRSIERADLERAAEGTVEPPGPGDVALVRTGWGRLWDDPGRYRSPAGLPGIDRSAAEWLAQRGVLAIGSDTLTVESYHQEHNRDLPVHAYCLVDRGILLFENLFLEELARHGIRDGLFIALPLKIVGATASPVRPIAIG